MATTKFVASIFSEVSQFHTSNLFLLNQVHRTMYLLSLYLFVNKRGFLGATFVAQVDDIFVKSGAVLITTVIVRLAGIPVDVLGQVE